MMVDILLTNQPAVEQMLAIARVQIDQFAQALADGDEPTLRTLMEQAAQQRKRLY
jgi:prephenate dehydrogenase